jgi:hypothetical protein
MTRFQCPTWKSTLHQFTISYGEPISVPAPPAHRSLEIEIDL